MANVTIPSTFKKAAFLISSKSELLAERDYMEANWKPEMRTRMQTLTMISYQKFGVTIANLA